MTNESTINKLIEMRLTTMADSFRIQKDDVSMKDVPFDDRFGMLVDAVTEVLSLENEPVDTKKATNARESSRFLSGIGNINGRLIVLLNLEEIVGLPKEVK